MSALDLFVHGDPHAVWRPLRAADPVHWNARTGRYRADEGFWSITGYYDAIAVYRDPQCYSSERGVALTFDLTQAEEAEREMGYGRMLIMTDPSRHVQMRQAFSRRFAARALAVHEPLIRALTREIVDAVAAQGRCDFVADVAARLPTAVLCELMRIPAVDRGLMFMVANQSIGYQDEEFNQQGHDGTSANRMAQMAFFSYFMNLVAKRRARPGEDLVSALIAGENEAGPLDDMGILFNCFLLIIVGQETTRNAISSGLLALLETPQLWRRLCSLSVSIRYNSELFDPATIARVAKYFQALLVRVTTQADARLDTLKDLFTDLDKQEQAATQQQYRRANVQRLKTVKRVPVTAPHVGSVGTNPTGIPGQPHDPPRLHLNGASPGSQQPARNTTN